MSRRAAADNPVQEEDLVLVFAQQQTQKQPQKQQIQGNSLLSDDNVVAFAPGVLEQLSAQSHVGLPPAGGRDEEWKANAVIPYEDAMAALENEYTMKQGMSIANYAPVNKLKNIRKKSDLSLRAPGQGQTKLLVSEMRFFETHFDIMNPKKNPGSPSFTWTRDKQIPATRYTSVVMYVGAADGHHIAQFTQIYPNTLFVLVDGRAPHFGLREAQFRNIHSIREKWFGQKEVKAFFTSDKGPGKSILGSGCPVLFISDIRSGNTRLMHEDEGDKMVEDDQKTQTRILEAVRSKVYVNAFIVKFRAPFSYEEGKPTASRVKGQLWIQSYAPHSSTELRIVGECPEDRSMPVGTEFYSIPTLERRMAYINTEKRVRTSFDAKQVACVVALMRENRKSWGTMGKEDHEDIFRFKMAIMNYNVPTDDLERVKWASIMPCTL